MFNRFLLLKDDTQLKYLQQLQLIYIFVVKGNY